MASKDQNLVTSPDICINLSSPERKEINTIHTNRENYFKKLLHNHEGSINLLGETVGLGKGGRSRSN